MPVPYRKIALLVLVLGLLGFAPIYLLAKHSGSAWLTDHGGGCADVPLVRVETPYGLVGACRELDRDAPLWEQPDVISFVVIEAVRGVVVLRIEYRDINAGRQYTAVAYELTPDDAPGGLTEEEATRHRDDVDARGGIRTQAWGLHAGDG